MKLYAIFKMKLTILMFFILWEQPNAYTQVRTINIGPNQYAASLEMTPDNYEYLIVNNVAVLRDSLVKFSNEIYSKFNDDFDFIVYLFNEDYFQDGVRPEFPFFGQAHNVTNTVTGIGLSTFNHTAQWGSAGKLKTVIIMPVREFIFYGPFLHEICHTWANFGIPARWWNGQEISYPHHWGLTGGSTKGQLGGFQQSTLETNIDGDPNKYRVASFGANANGGNTVTYNKLELYLMGMIPISDVPSFDVFSGTTGISYGGSTLTFTAATRTTYDPASLEALLGQRNPSSINSQKNFRTLFVLLTPAPVTADEWYIVEHHANLMGIPGSDGTSFNNFWEATEGLATMQTGNLLNAVLPVQFGVITASVKDDLLKVNWSTLSEENNDHFIIEASADGKNFTEIGRLKSAAKDGNSDVPVHYTFSLNTDNLGIAGMAGFGLFALLCFAARRNRRLFAVAALVCATAFISCNKDTDALNTSPEGNIYIRIAQVDKDGTKTYSKVVKAVRK